MRIWSGELKGKQFCIYCDNQAVVNLINQGTAKEEGMQTLMRLFAFVAAMGQMEVGAVHLSSQENRVPDLLSRFHLGHHYVQQFENIRQPNWQEAKIQSEHWDVNEMW